MDIVNDIWILLYFSEEGWFFFFFLKRQTINLIGLKLPTLSFGIAKSLVEPFILCLAALNLPVTYMVQVSPREFGMPRLWFPLSQNYPSLSSDPGLTSRQQSRSLPFCSSGQKIGWFSFRDLVTSVVTSLSYPQAENCKKWGCHLVPFFFPSECWLPLESAYLLFILQ